MSFETLCRKSFLMLATLAYSWVIVILAFAFRQFIENFFFRAMRRRHFANLGRNFLSG